MKFNKSIVTACLCALIVVGIIFGSDIEKRVEVEAQNTDATQYGSNEGSVADSSDTSTTVDGSLAGDTSNSSTSDGNSGQSSDSKYKDGTYIGSASAYNGDIKVSVVVSSGKITSIDIVETGDDEAYLSKAKSVIDEIISSQSTNVQTVSGATYSSSGIINAVNNALSSGGA